VIVETGIVHRMLAQWISRDEEYLEANGRRVGDGRTSKTDAFLMTNKSGI